MNNEAINEMAAAIVSSRDFCGDERSAAREACFDVAGRYRLPTKTGAATGRADAAWMG